MRFTNVATAAVVALGAVALAACGGGSYSSKSQPAAPVASVAYGANAANRGDTTLGRVLVSSTGHTVYARTTDNKHKSTCVGACAKTCPPVLVDKGWSVGPGLDTRFSTIVRDDGTRQLVDGQWPLYTFSGDSKPGDVNGEGLGGVWFAVGTNAALVTNAPSSPVPPNAGSSY